MAFQISPGVNVSEVDLTTVVPSVLTTAGAFVGTFDWGPAQEIVLTDSEITVLKTFGQPSSNSAVSFFSAANFLAYGNNLRVVRAVGANCKNATVTSGAAIRVNNEDVFQENYLSANTNTNIYYFHLYLLFNSPLMLLYNTSIDSNCLVNSIIISFVLSNSPIKKSLASTRSLFPVFTTSLPISITLFNSILC